MKKYTKQDIIDRVQKEDIEFIRLQFTDIFGSLKNVAISANQLERALDNKYMFDGSSIDGYARKEEADMCLYPDLDTFELAAWRPKVGKVARMLCDVYLPNGVPFSGDSRYILKRVLKKSAKLGYTFNVGPECEFFLFHTDEVGRATTMSHDRAGYFDVAPLDLGEDARRDIILTLEGMGFEIEESHHEVAAAQHEIDFKYDNALKTADNIMTFKFTVKAIAKKHGLYASFMPKPITGVDGSGMHLNMSLFRDKKNIFTDKSDETGLGLSRECYHFIAGILKHAKGLTLIGNPIVNSYKRLADGREAPIDIGWSCMSQRPLIRIPSSRGAETRIEYRSPDPSANPYLLLACTLAAGLDGIEQKLEIPRRIDYTFYEMTEGERKKAGIEKLPMSLIEAADAFYADELLMKVLGPFVAKKFIEAKRAEWERYERQVTDWELREYLGRI